MIKDLASIKNIKLSESSVNKLKIAAIRVSGWRDLLAHGVWGKDADGWKVQQTKGRHAKDAIVPHRSKRISPEGFLADAAGLQSITADVDRLIEEILPIRKTVKEQIAALIQKGPEQL